MTERRTATRRIVILAFGLVIVGLVAWGFATYPPSSPTTIGPLPSGAIAP